MNTETPPPLSNAECLSVLTDNRLVRELNPTQTRALFRAVHALARRTMQRERNASARAASTFRTPPEVAAAVLANEIAAACASGRVPDRRLVAEWSLASMRTYARENNLRPRECGAPLGEGNKPSGTSSPRVSPR